MAAILADDIFKLIFLNENDRNPIQISLKFVSRSTIDNKLALFQVMTWCWTSGKPLPEPKMTQFTMFKTNGRPVALGDQKLGWTS